MTDICPISTTGKTCKGLQVDMYNAAWNVLAHDSNPADVQVQRVECPPPSGTIHAYVLANNGPGQFLKVVFQDVGGSGLLVHVTQTCGWEVAPLKNQYGAVWVTPMQPLGANKGCTYTLQTDDGAKVRCYAHNCVPCYPCSAACTAPLLPGAAVGVR